MKDLLLIFIKFTYSEKATKFCEIFTLLLTTVHRVKSKAKISQNFVAFSECMNFMQSQICEILHYFLIYQFDMFFII